MIMTVLLMAFLFIGLGLLVFRSTLPKRRIKRWQRTLALDTHRPCFEELYADVNGFALSRAARAKQDAVEFTYGEIDFESFIALLTLCKPHQGTVFYDLGSGTGKAVLACAMVFNVRKSCGIEWFSLLHDAAIRQQQRLSALPQYQQTAKAIAFKQDDFLSYQLADASIIFINASTFFGDYWELISHHLEHVQTGTLVVSTSKCLRSDQFILQKSTYVSMSWGVVPVFIQARLPIQ